MYFISFNGSDNQSAVYYNGLNGSKSSVIILANSLVAGHTYQFAVVMVSLKNSSRQGTGFVLVHIEDSKPKMIAVRFD